MEESAAERQQRFQNTAAARLVKSAKPIPPALVERIHALTKDVPVNLDERIEGDVTL